MTTLNQLGNLARLQGNSQRAVTLLKQCLANNDNDEMKAFAEFQSRIHETA